MNIFKRLMNDFKNIDPWFSFFKLSVHKFLYVTPNSAFI